MAAEYETKRYVFDCRCDFITSVSFSPDAALLATADNLPAIRLWRMRDGEENLRLALPGEDTSDVWFEWVEFLPDPAQLLAIDTQGCLRFWEADSRRCRQLAGSVAGIVAAAGAAMGRTVALGTDHGAVFLWDLITDRRTCVLEPRGGYMNLVTCLAFSPTRSRVAASTESDNSIRVHWIGEELGQQCLVGHKDCVLSLDYSPDGHLLASASRDNTVRIWELEHGTEVAAFQGEGNIVRSVAFSPNGALLAVANGYRSFSTENPASAVSMLRVGDGSRVCRLVAHGDSVEALSFSRNGQLLASGGHDGRVIVWDAAEFGEHHT